MSNTSRPSVRVADLLPGDVVETPTRDRACFVVQTRHPVWLDLRFVVWRMPDGSWSHDALSSEQVVGHLVTQRGSHEARLRAACTGGTGSWQDHVA